jgi:hypothetical protein
MRIVFAFALSMLAAAPAIAQQSGAWNVSCSAGACSASSTARGAAPLSMKIERGPVVTLEGGSFNPQGVLIFAFNGMQTTFVPVTTYLHDGGRRITIGPDEISREIVHQGQHAKQMTVSLPLTTGERKVDFDVDGFAAAAAKVTGR